MKRPLKKPVSLVLALILLLALLPVWAITPAAAAGSTESEPNDSMDSANTISLNTKISGNRGETYDYDWFRFTLPSDGVISLTFGHQSQISGSGNYWASSFYTSDENALGDWSFWAGNTTADETTCQIGLSKGTYYLCIEEADNYSAQTYHFTVNFTASTAWEKERNDSIIKPNTIALNSKVNGSLIMDYDCDWFRFTLPNDGFISLTFGPNTPITGGDDCWTSAFFTSDGSILDDWSFWNNGATTDQTGCKIGLPAGTYYLCIESTTEYSSQAYHFKLSFTASTAWEKERNNTIVSPTAISLNTQYNGSVSSYGDTDWFSFTLPAADTIRLVFGHEVDSNGSDCWSTCFYNSDGDCVGDWIYWNGKTATDGITDEIDLPKGTYYLYIDSGFEYSPKAYHFIVRTGTQDPPVLTASASADSAVLKWTAIAGATQYRVYRRDNESGTWSGWSMVTKLTKANWNDTTAQPGYQYKYRVKAYAGGAWTEYSNAVNVAIPKAPVLTVTASAGKAALSWTAVSGATQYRIYRRDNAGGSWSSWSMVKRLTSGTAWNDTDVVGGKQYKYEVRAYVGSAWTDYSNAVAVSIPAPPVLTATATTGKIKLSWTAVSGATQYRIYRRDNESGSWSDWSMVKRLTSGTSWTDTTTKAGKSYKYRVRANVGGDWTDYSNAVVLAAK